MSLDCPVLFVIVLCLVPSFDKVYGLSSLVCDRSVSCDPCCQCLWIVQSCSWSFSILCPVLPMSLDCPVLFVIVLCLVPRVANVSGLSNLVCDRSVSCASSYQFLWIVQSCLWSFCVLCPMLPMSLDYPVLFVIVLCLVPSFANVSGFSNLVCDRSVSCAPCCQCLWIVQSCLWLFCVLFPVLPMSMDCPVLFVIVMCLVSSVGYVSGLSSLVCDRSVSCAQCCQCLWIVQSCLWSFCILCPVLPISMDCPVLFVIVLCLVPRVAYVSGLTNRFCNRSVSCGPCCLCL